MPGENDFIDDPGTGNDVACRGRCPVRVAVGRQWRKSGLVVRVRHRIKVATAESPGGKPRTLQFDSQVCSHRLPLRINRVSRRELLAAVRRLGAGDSFETTRSNGWLPAFSFSPVSTRSDD